MYSIHKLHREVLRSPHGPLDCGELVVIGQVPPHDPAEPPAVHDPPRSRCHSAPESDLRDAPVPGHGSQPITTNLLFVMKMKFMKIYE